MDLHDSDIPALAAEAGLGAQRFRSVLRELKAAVPMDVLEHSDGVWEIVYGPSYTRPKTAVPPSGQAGGDGIRAFTMPGWEQYSTWGYEEGLGHLYAQLYRNTDDRDAAPRIWITPPGHVVTTVDQLAKVIAEAIAPHELVPPPTELIKMWLTR
ncbi:hypothetical protein AB0F17_34645 [Nonomuraea sp. NPDC026600]|uniref:hypothetical protein n=1 Tax=Nonomuraea sp. NPDC026600 TaxID=3155363 RepID=UPI0034008244